MILIISITLQGFLYLGPLFYAALLKNVSEIPCKPHPALTPGLEARSLDTRRLTALKLSQNTPGILKPLALPKTISRNPQGPISRSPALSLKAPKAP